MHALSRRYTLAAAVATLWCLVLTPVQVYVFASPERPGWLSPLETPLRSLVEQGTRALPHLDPYYIFGRLFFPSFLFLAYAFVGVHLSQRESAGRVHNLLSKVLIAATALGGVADAVTYWGGNNPEVGDFKGVQLAGWAVEELALVTMVAATIALGVASIRAGTLPRWTGYLLAGAGLVAFPAGILTYIPHGVVLVLGVACLLVTSSLPGVGVDRRLHADSSRSG